MRTTSRSTDPAMPTMAAMAIMVNPASPSAGPPASAIAVGPYCDGLVDGQRAEDAERDQDVHDRRDPERTIHRPRQVPGGIAQVSGSEGDHAESEIGEERQRDAGDDVREGG